MGSRGIFDGFNFLPSWCFQPTWTIWVSGFNHRYIPWERLKHTYWKIDRIQSHHLSLSSQLFCPPSSPLSTILHRPSSLQARMTDPVDFTPRAWKTDTEELWFAIDEGCEHVPVVRIDLSWNKQVLDMWHVHAVLGVAEKLLEGRLQLCMCEWIGFKMF